MPLKVFENVRVDEVRLGQLVRIEDARTAADPFPHRYELEIVGIDNHDITGVVCYIWSSYEVDAENQPIWAHHLAGGVEVEVGAKMTFVAANIDSIERRAR